MPRNPINDRPLNSHRIEHVGHYDVNWCPEANLWVFSFEDKVEFTVDRIDMTFLRAERLIEKHEADLDVVVEWVA